MKHPQVIDLNEQSVLAFNEHDVINNFQIPIYTEEVSSLLVDVRLYNLTAGASFTISAITMSHNLEAGHWTIDIADISGDLLDRNKYVGKVRANIAEPEVMQDFYISEFAVDNDSLEATLMRLPYEIKISGGEAWFIWYAAGQIGVAGQEKFYANAYEGGTGTTFASDTSRVTHRDAVNVGGPPVAPPPPP